MVQEPSLEDFHLSPDKSHLLIHSKKYLRVVNLADRSTLCTITNLSHKSSAHDIVSAHFNSDGTRVVAARQRVIGQYSLTSCLCNIEYAT